MNKQRKVIFIFIFLFIFMIGGLFLNQFFAKEHEAKIVIDRFYYFEQNGNFSNSWAMFHPYMKEKFSKAHYLQDRVHVFFNHFGVDTFEYHVGELKEINGWIFEEGFDPIDVYSAPVTKTFKSKYGNFTITQNVYAAKVQGEWTILWDYKK